MLFRKVIKQEICKIILASRRDIDTRTKSWIRATQRQYIVGRSTMKQSGARPRDRNRSWIGTITLLLPQDIEFCPTSHQEVI